MRIKPLPFACVSLIVLAVQSASAGDYQKTKDGKTLVWNNRPQPNDIVNWSGKTGDDGYATGPGTLSWYVGTPEMVVGSNIPKTKLNLTSRYTGTMVHGKFEGPVVNVDANGKTYHGTYVDGHKSGRWVAGPPTKGESEPAVAAASPKKEPAEADAVVANSPAPVKEKNAGPSVEVETPAEGPSPDRAVATMEKRKPTTPPPPSAAEGNRPASHDVDDSLRSLVGPPKDLQPKAAAESTPPPAPAASASPSPAQPSMHLSGARASNIADGEARAQGYNVTEYKRGEALFDPVEQSWSVSYEQVTPYGVGKRFTVTVSDKTEKAAITSR